MEVQNTYAQTEGKCRSSGGPAKRALALLDSGCSLNEVGRRIGCNASSVMRWRDARRRGGDRALRVRFSPGRPKLDAAQRKRLSVCC